MKLLTRFIGSSAIVIGLVTILIGSSTLLINRRERSVELSHARADQALQKTQELQVSLEKQTSALKDYLLLNGRTADIAKYQKAMSNFLATLEELQRLMPEAMEISVVRQRHQFLVHLADALKASNEYTPFQAQQDVRAINSFSDDINLYLNLLVANAKQQANQTNRAAAQFKHNAQIATLCKS